jgi:hypothetical protein
MESLSIDGLMLHPADGKCEITVDNGYSLAYREFNKEDVTQIRDWLTKWLNSLD